MRFRFDRKTLYGTKFHCIYVLPIEVPMKLTTTAHGAISYKNIRRNHIYIYELRKNDKTQTKPANNLSWRSSRLALHS